MAQEKIAKNNELAQIMKLVEDGQNFLLSGGAGSGKTYTLVEVLKSLLSKYPSSKIACMTYTNSAVKEIQERIDHSNLIVSTYHDFLWDCIKHFQKELKAALIELINDEHFPFFTTSENQVIDETYYNELEHGIQYKEYVRIRDGIISHDEVLVLASKVFERNHKICRIIKDKFPFILIDEYQDTQPVVIEILLEHLKKACNQCVIGFFGDSMQAIYDNGVGDLDDYVGEEVGLVYEVQKTQNRRSPGKVIRLANLVRTDGLSQTPSLDPTAPNIDQDGRLKDGDIKFIYSSSNDLVKVREYLKWDFENSKETKELNLTHNLIATKAGFETLMAIYDKDRIISYSNKVKKYIKNNEIQIEDLMTFGDVLAMNTIDVPKTKVTQSFLKEFPELMEYAKTQKWSLFSKIYLNKDQLIDDKKQSSDEESKKGSNRDNLIKHLFKIEHCIHLYQTEQYNEFLRKTEFSIKTPEDKSRLREIIESFSDTSDQTIGDVIGLADKEGLVRIDDSLEKFILEEEYVYSRVVRVNYQEFKDLYRYLQGYTPFTTKHKTKGNEFNNVLIILDNGGWNSYNFEYLFLNRGNPSVLHRTSKIFYTSCTRAKENLAVFYLNPTGDVIGSAKSWFGEENIINLDEL